MSEMYERIDNLCKKRGINITTMCREAGVSRGNLTDLKMGRQSGLNVKNAMKIAEYFGVTVEYLTFGEEVLKPTEESKTNIIKIAGRNGVYVERHLTDAQIAAFTAMLEQLPDVPDDL